MKIKEKILLIEDERTIRGFMQAILTANGYDVLMAGTGAMANTMISSHCPDLIILDLGLPDMDGMTILRSVREWSKVPILVVSARSHERDKVEALDAGADDYLTKPFNILELKARVRALLRRAAGVQRSQGSLLTVGKLTLNTEERVAIRDGEPVELTAKEYDLIELLMRNPRRVYSRENLMNVVWGYTYAGDYRTVDVHIRRLREKLEENPAEPDHILTKWGVGYYFKG